MLHISQPTWEKLSFPVNLSQCFHNSWEAALKPSKSFSHIAGFRRLARAGQTLRDRANLSRTYQSPQLSSCYGILLCLGMVNVMQTWLTELHCYRKHEKSISQVTEILKMLWSSGLPGPWLTVTLTFYQELSVRNQSKQLFALVAGVIPFHKDVSDL